MPKLNEENGMHAQDMTWSAYKSLVAASGEEEDKIYFIEDLSSQIDAIQELSSTMKQLKELLGINT